MITAYKYLVVANGVYRSPAYYSFVWTPGMWHLAKDRLHGIYCFSEPCRPVAFANCRHPGLRLAVVDVILPGRHRFVAAGKLVGDYRQVRLAGWYTGNIE